MEKEKYILQEIKSDAKQQGSNAVNVSNHSKETIIGFYTDSLKFNFLILHLSKLGLKFLFKVNKKLFRFSIQKISQLSILQFLAQIMCFFLFPVFCLSTSEVPLKHLFSTIPAPSKDVVSTSDKIIVGKLANSIVQIILFKIPQFLPRPPTVQIVILCAGGISPLANKQ